MAVIGLFAFDSRRQALTKVVTFPALRVRIGWSKLLHYARCNDSLSAVAKVHTGLISEGQTSARGGAASMLSIWMSSVKS